MTSRSNSSSSRLEGQGRLKPCRAVYWFSFWSWRWKPGPRWTLDWHFWREKAVRPRSWCFCWCTWGCCGFGRSPCVSACPRGFSPSLCTSCRSRPRWFRVWDYCSPWILLILPPEKADLFSWAFWMVCSDQWGSWALRRVRVRGWRGWWSLW